MQEADPDFGQAAWNSSLLFAFRVDGMLGCANVKLWVGVGCLAVNDKTGEMGCFSVYTLRKVYTRPAVTELHCDEHYLVSMVVER